MQVNERYGEVAKVNRLSAVQRRRNPIGVVNIKELGENIRARRVGLGMTQQDLEARSGVSICTLSRIEKGVVEVGILKLFYIAEALGCNICELIDGGWIEVKFTKCRKCGANLDHGEVCECERISIPAAIGRYIGKEISSRGAVKNA